MENVENVENVEIGQLPSKPLIEAIFELRWKIKEIAPGLSEDPGFPSLPIKYYQKISGRFPELVDLPAARIPEQMAPYTVRSQFRAGKDEWPLTQLGPGILTVNQTRDYSVWGDFRDTVQDCVEAISAAYPKTLTPILAELRYINAVPRPGDETNLTEFIASKFHTRVETSNELYDGKQHGAIPDDVNLDLRFPLKCPAGHGMIAFATGTANDKPSLIWQLAVRSAKSQAPAISSLNEWLEDSHKIIDNWFLQLTEGDLMTQFKEQEDAR